MELTQEYRGLIEKIIINNTKYSGNEDLLEDFCSETFKRCYLILSSVQNITHIQSYVNKVANTAILEVLKTSGRLQRTTDGYKKIEQTTLVIEPKKEHPITDEIVFDIPDPSPHFVETIIEKEKIQHIAEILIGIDAQSPQKNYLELFNLRYIKNLKQKEISQQLDISQGEVSKRLIEVTQKINELYEKNEVENN